MTSYTFILQFLFPKIFIGTWRWQFNWSVCEARRAWQWSESRFVRHCWV